MKYICPFCGSALLRLRILHVQYASAFRCPNESFRNFLEVVGTHHSYPRQNLESGVAEILMEASEEIIDKAFSRIKHIDHKTISIPYFEQTLPGIYQNKEYQRVRAD